MALPYIPYKEQILDPRWQKRRLEILNRDKFSCTYCGETKLTLHVHHTYYENDVYIWDAKDEYLTTLCCEHHKYFHDRIPEYFNEVLDFFKMKLKDPFIAGCAADLFQDFKDVHSLIYLLWELRDNEKKILDVLTKMFQKECDKVSKKISEKYGQQIP